MAPKPIISAREFVLAPSKQKKTHAKMGLLIRKGKFTYIDRKVRRR